MAEEKVTGEKIDAAVESVSDKLDADILFINSEMERPYDQQVIDACIERRRRTNVLLILVTTGGNADVAFRIARCLQCKYEKFYLYVPGYCKSAGTLVALGANEIIFSDHGELGPLDVQMNKKDDLFQLQSGYTVMDALTALQDKAFLTFERSFLDIEERSGGTITVKTAGEMATNLTVGLFSSLFGQVDPLHIGESARALSIAKAYGIRLQERSGNWDESSLSRLLSGYPSHGFVIDRHEATTLFNNVREPDEVEIELAKSLNDYARIPQVRKDFVLTFLNQERELKEEAVGRKKPVPVANVSPINTEEGEGNEKVAKGAA